MSTPPYANDPAAQLAALERAIAAMPPVPRPRHPAPGCSCVPCTERDDYLEGVAERRAEQARGDY